MLKAVFTLYSALSESLTRLVLILSCLAVVILTGAMLYEVVARYVFTAPTLWAFDMAYMSNAAIFLLGNAWVLRNHGHITISLLYDKLPRALRVWLDVITQLCLIFPLFILLTVKAGQYVIRAYQSGEVEMVSPWGPLMWPFYLVFALGLLAFALQIPTSLYQRHVQGQRTEVHV